MQEVENLARPQLGEAWPQSSLIWGARAGKGEAINHVSPVDRAPVGTVQMLDEDEMNSLIAGCAPTLSVMPDEALNFSVRLYAALKAREPELLEALKVETGFVHADCEELLSGILAYAQRFPDAIKFPTRDPHHYHVGEELRRIRQVAVPWGNIAVILPQSATLIIGVTCLLNALAAGNRVILRAPVQRPRSAALLADAIAEAQPPQNAVSVVLTRAKEFTAHLNASSAPILVHYMGSSRYAPSLLAETFKHSKPVIIDGEGNVWVWVGADADPEAVAETLTRGALRYNGQTCTSINGVLIHPDLYDAVRDRLVARWNALSAGDSLQHDEVQVGPLMDEGQAEWCQTRALESGGTVLAGGRREKNLLFPTLVEGPEWDSDLVTQGVFGGVLWLRAATQDEFVAQWANNRYPLCAGIISPAVDAAWWLTRLANVARLSINGDPSIEDIFEPWGGYPATGTNPVTTWIEKYCRTVAIDEPVTV